MNPGNFLEKLKSSVPGFSILNPETDKNIDNLVLNETEEDIFINRDIGELNLNESEENISTEKNNPFSVEKKVLSGNSRHESNSEGTSSQNPEDSPIIILGANIVF